MPRHMCFRFCLDPSVEQELRAGIGDQERPRSVSGAESGEGDTQPTRDSENGLVGVDQGLHALAVAGTSNGTEVLRVENSRVLRRGLPRLRRLSKAVSRKKRGSKNRKKAVVRLSRQYARIRDRRRHVLHQVSNQLVKNHARGRGGKELDDVGTNRPHPRPDWTPEKGGVSQATQLLKHAVGCPP